MIRAHLLLIAALTGAPFVMAEDPKSRGALEFGQTSLKQHRDYTKRVNGTSLTSTAHIEGENLRIDWALDYDCPRPR